MEGILESSEQVIKDVRLYLMKVKEMPKHDRPREKLERYGVVRLSEQELLALLLGSGIKGVNVVQLANKIQKLVEKEGSNITLEKLVEIKGLGKIKAGIILAALEYGKRIFSKLPEVVVTPEKVFELCADIRDSRKEHFVAFYLNSRNVLIEREILSVGTLDSSLVHPREVFEPALRHGAAGLIVAHNHPSGDCEPSEDDVVVTKRLREVSILMGIDFIDHIIVTKMNLLSFKQKGVIS